MKVVLHMAQTLNGIIARENGSEDFLSDENWSIFCKLAEKFDCLVVGRKTYETVQKWKDYNYDSIKSIKIIVSADKKFKTGRGCILANSPEEALSKASSSGFNKVLLVGGSKINSAFMKKSLINEISVDIEPFVLGRGIKMFAEEDFEFKLKLKSIKKFSSGLIRLHYLVLNS